METTSKISIKDIAGNSLAIKQAHFLAAYTGIEESQLAVLGEFQRAKVFFGLVKQLELVSSLHSQPAENHLTAKDNLRGLLMEYFTDPSLDIKSLSSKINSLLAFGEIRDLTGTGVEDIHSQLAHFWRILGWEELSYINSQFNSKHTPGSIEEVESSCGNLIRTLELLKEFWEENNIGPKIVVPKKQARLKIENNPGYSVVRQIVHPNVTAIVTSRNGIKPTEKGRHDFKDKALLLEKLLSKYPAEFAFLIFEYYSFVKGQDAKAYNLAVIQEYVLDGQPKVKGLLSGKFSVAHGVKIDEGKYRYELLSKSDSDIPVGSPSATQIVYFDTALSKGDAILVTHGPVAYAINHFPQILKAFEGEKNISHAVSQFSKSIGASELKKPIVHLVLGNAQEIPMVEINEDTMNQVLSEVIRWSKQKGIKNIIIEAGHLHADRKPTKLQKTGIKVGAYLAHGLNQSGIHVKPQTMIDEDHVINTLDYSNYLNLMKSLGYDVQEIIYESSPITREIAVAAIASLLEMYPNNVYLEGDALIFNIPGTDMQVELVKDVTISPFELGCVIFDVGLSLYKAYPELAQLYGFFKEGPAIHQGMYEIYKQNSNPDERLQKVRMNFPYQTQNWSEVESNQGLPKLPNGDHAVMNILEGFYTPQQKKLVGVLKSLGIKIPIIGVTITDQGLTVDIME